MRNVIAGFGALVLLAACSADETKGENATTGESAGLSGPAGRFYDRERFTIVYNLTGAQTGTRTEHVRNWGRERATTEDSAIEVMGVRQPVRSRQVHEGRLIYAVDLATGETTVSENPLYDEIVAGAQAQGGVEFGKTMMRRLGGQETGETGRFAGHDCAYWTLMGTRACVTAWGGTVHVETAMAGLRIEQTATEVRMGDGGPDSAFVVDRAAARRVEVPDLSMEDMEAATAEGRAALERLQRMTPPQG